MPAGRAAEVAVTDVVVFGARELGAAIARSLCEQGLAVRVIEPGAWTEWLRQALKPRDLQA